MFIRRSLSGLKKRIAAYWNSHIMVPDTLKLQFPVNPYVVNDDYFMKKVTASGREWGLHLGEDCDVPAGTKVSPIGKGRVVYARKHPGHPDHPNWGGLVIIAHKNIVRRKVFYSVYGHIANILVRPGDYVSPGDVIGEIAPAMSFENGWWQNEHLHLGIYVGPWKGNVLPGYYREDQNLTIPEWWENPSLFIRRYP